MHIRHDPDAKTFVVGKDDWQGVLEYQNTEDGAIDLRNTFVLEEHRGQGIATGLVRSALGHALAHGRRVVGTCPFAATILDTDPAFRGLKVSRGSRNTPKDRTRRLRYALEGARA